MSRITAQDLALADVLLDAAEAYVQDDAKGVRKVAQNTIAKLLADIHERAVACAMVRLEREFEVQRRKQPGLPFDER